MMTVVDNFNRKTTQEDCPPQVAVLTGVRSVPAGKRHRRELESDSDLAQLARLFHNKECILPKSTTTVSIHSSDMKQEGRHMSVCYTSRTNTGKTCIWSGKDLHLVRATRKYSPRSEEVEARAFHIIASVTCFGNLRHGYQVNSAGMDTNQSCALSGCKQAWDHKVHDQDLAVID